MSHAFSVMSVRESVTSNICSHLSSGADDPCLLDVTRSHHFKGLCINLNSFETSQTTCPIPQHHIPEELNFVGVSTMRRGGLVRLFCVKTVTPCHPHSPFNRSYVSIRLFHLMKQHFWNEVCSMCSYLNAYSKGSGIVIDMLDVTPMCCNFCPCANRTWCGLHGVDVAVT